MVACTKGIVLQMLCRLCEIYTCTVCSSSLQSITYHCWFPLECAGVKKCLQRPLLSLAGLLSYDSVDGPVSCLLWWWGCLHNLSTSAELASHVNPLAQLPPDPTPPLSHPPQKWGFRLNRPSASCCNLVLGIVLAQSLHATPHAHLPRTMT